MWTGQLPWASLAAAVHRHSREHGAGMGRAGMDPHGGHVMPCLPHPEICPIQVYVELLELLEL